MNITIYIILLISLTWTTKSTIRIKNLITTTHLNKVGAKGLLVNWCNPLGERMEPLRLKPVGLLDGMDSYLTVQLELTQIGERLTVWGVKQSVEKFVDILNQRVRNADSVEISE